MGSFHLGRVLLVLLLASLLVCCLATVADAQGLQTSPYSAPSMLRGLSGGGLGLAPSNAGGSSSLYVSDEMLRGILPLIPNLQFGYLYDFGNNRVSQGRFTADYLLPFRLNADSMIFGEAHTEFQDFWKTLKSTFTSVNSFNNRVDMSFGGGYRTFLRRDTLLGVNGFYDTSRLGGTWYSSGSVGLEMAALVGGDALDLNFNWYGQLFNSNVIATAFRAGPANFDFQAGYSHELWNGGPDLRLSATGYKFDVGNSVYGWNAGAELKSRDGVFVLKYAVGHDRLDKTYQTVGGFVNVGLQLQNLLKGESPFTMPEPIFKSPRNLWYMLTQKVVRNWNQPASVILVQNAGGGAQAAGGRRIIVETITGATFAALVGFIPFDSGNSYPNAQFTAFANVHVTSAGTFGQGTDLHWGEGPGVTLIEPAFADVAFGSSIDADVNHTATHAGGTQSVTGILWDWDTTLPLPAPRTVPTLTVTITE